MTGRPDNVAALIEAVERAAERGAERATVAALDRYLPHVTERSLDRPDDAPAEAAARPQRIKTLLDGRRVVTWLDSEIGPARINEVLGNRSTAARWRSGKGARPETLRQLLDRAGRPDLRCLLEDEEYLRALDGDPSGLLDELPPEPAGTEGAGDGGEVAAS